MCREKEGVERKINKRERECGRQNRKRNKRGKRVYIRKEKEIGKERWYRVEERKRNGP